MIYNVDNLRKDTVALITTINAQIEELEKIATAQGISSTMLMDGHGNWPLGPLLNAKATAYNTLVMLQTQERVAGRTGPPRRQ